MTISSASSTGTQNYPATNEIFISFYVRIAAVPSGQVRLLRISDSGTTVGAITLETTGKITLRNGTTSCRRLAKSRAEYKGVAPQVRHKRDRCKRRVGSLFGDR